MGAFGWKSTFPIRLGGGGHNSVEDIYESLKANVGDALSTEDETAHDAELKAIARLLSIGDRALERYQRQADFRKVSQLLDRWEDVLAIRSSVNDSLVERRNRVAARLRTNFNATAEGVSRVAAASFYPWTTDVHYTPLSDAVLYWPGGTTLSGYPWYSTVCHFSVEYRRPQGSSEADVSARRDACEASLDEYVPAWATFDMSETQTTGDNANEYGFYLDQPNLDKSCFRV